MAKRKPLPRTKLSRCPNIKLSGSSPQAAPRAGRSRNPTTRPRRGTTDGRRVRDLWHRRALRQRGFPGISWPLTPGHEIAGKVAEVGDGVQDFAIGDRVAVGWFGGCCYRCDQCRKGLFIHCANGKVPSWQYPGGYAESVTVPVSALARIPAELSDAEAAPWGVPASPPTTRCVTRKPCPAIAWRYWASVAWATSACSSPGRWASRPSRSTAAAARPMTPGNWAPITTSIPPPTIPPKR